MKDKKFRRLRIPKHPNPKRQNPGFQNAPEKMDEKMKKKCGQSTGERGELSKWKFYPSSRILPPCTSDDF